MSVTIKVAVIFQLPLTGTNLREYRGREEKNSLNKMKNRVKSVIIPLF